MTLTPGENVGPYRIIEQLGSGGMATVFKAYHPSLDRYVAIKVLHPAFKANPQFFERFQREARIVARLEHAHIIPVYDFNEHQGEPYLVMRFVEGVTLKTQMDGKRLPTPEVLRLMRPVCEALAYAHGEGVLHRDIKPSNIMVTSAGNVFVTDFGLARMVQVGESTLSQDMMVGTPQYISPEQARGVSDLDGRTDIYSLGVVLFEMLTGQVPFSADTPFATIHDHIYAPLPLPSVLNPDIKPEVERMLLKALAKEPDERFTTVEELLTTLETTLEHQISTASTGVTSPEATALSSARVGKNKNPKGGFSWWVGAAIGLLILFILGGVLAGLLLWRGAYRDGTPPADDVVARSGQPEQDLPSPPDRLNQGGSDSDSPEHQRAAELSQEAARARQQHQTRQAIELYNQALAIDPHYIPAYLELSQTLWQSGDKAGSLAVLEKAVAQNPDSPVVWQRLGEAYLLADRNFKAALESFDRALQLAPDTATLYAEKGIALLALDRNEEAKQAIDTALQLDPFSHEVRLAHALYLMKQREREPAILTLRELAEDPRSPLFVHERARLLLERLSE